MFFKKKINRKNLSFLFACLLLLNLILPSITIIANVNENNDDFSNEDDDDFEFKQEEVKKLEEQKRNKLEEEILNNNNNLNTGFNPSIDINSSNITEWKFYIFSFYEVLMIAFLLSYIFVCLTGKTANNKLSYQWFNENNKYYSENYAHVGTGAEKGSGYLLQESYNNYKYYASGRKNINFTLVSLDLSKRHDLVTICSSIVLPYEKDRIIFELSLNVSYLPHVFNICRKKDLKYMKKTYKDIDFMTQAYSNSASLISGNNKSLVAMSEDDEVMNKIFLGDMTLLRLFREVESSIDIIYLTDRQTFSKESFVLFCSFYIKKDMKGSLEFSKFVHRLADRLAVIDFNNANRKDADKKRTEYNEHIEKLLIKQKESEEPKQRKEKPTKIPKTKEEAIKMEEKERKNRIKKERSKITKVMK